MGFNSGNITKSSFQTDIKKKQALFNRFKRRYKVSKDPGEKRFLKTEATRIVTDLKQCCKKWKNYGFGGYVWITKNFTVTNFTSTKSNWKTKSSPRKTTSCKSSNRSKSTRKCGSYGYSRSSSVRKPKSRAKKTYVAW